MVVARPVYAPALVAFVGGDGFGITLSAGGPTAAVGWVPLAPYEAYHPWYHANPVYVRNINAIVVRRAQLDQVSYPTRGGMVIQQPLANRGATVVVTAQAFTHAAPVQRARVDMPRDQVERLQVSNRRSMNVFRPTAEARAARPNTAAVAQPNARAQVAAQHVAYHPEPAAARAEPAVHAPGPRGPAVRPAASMRQNVLATPAQRPQPHPPGTQARPAAAAPQPAPRPGEQPRPAPHPQAAQPVHPAAVPAQPRAPAPAAHPQRPMQPHPQVQPRPQMQVQHPVQQMRLQATPHGWQRQAAPRPAAPAPHAAQPERKKE
jgi:hypothetical protein